MKLEGSRQFFPDHVATALCRTIQELEVKLAAWAEISRERAKERLRIISTLRVILELDVL